MPLPVRAQSIRSTKSEHKPTTSRSLRPTTNLQTPKTKATESKDNANFETTKYDAASSGTSTADPTNSSQASSRIPSPFKRNTSSHSSHSNQTGPPLSKPPTKGHVRQRSAAAPIAAPLLTARPQFGHSRSISAVSVNTTTSSTSSGVSRSLSKIGTDRIQQRSNLAKSKIQLNQPAVSTAATSSRSVLTQTQLEPVQNELLQLSVVYKQSASTTQRYQRSIEEFLALKQADLSSKRSIVQAQKQAFCATLNLLGLDSWLGTQGRQKTCQSLQNLSVVVKDLRNLESIFEGDDGLAAAFVSWKKRITDREANEEAMPDDFVTLHLDFESRLVPEIRRFRQQVSLALSSLSNLPECPPDTTLASLIHGHALLATSLVSQCQIMLQIGSHLVANHCLWLQDEVEATIMPRSNRHGRYSSQQISSPTWKV